jgi:hypothetical protein
MPGGAKADIRFGFWAGLGLVILLIVMMVAQMILTRARSASNQSG